GRWGGGAGSPRAATSNGATSFPSTIPDGTGGTATATVNVTVSPAGRALAVGGPMNGSVAVYAPDPTAGRFTGPAAGPQPFGAIPTNGRGAAGRGGGDGGPGTRMGTGPRGAVRGA